MDLSGRSSPVAGHQSPVSPGVDPYAGKWLNLAITSVSSFMLTLDASMVNVSLPSITDALRTSFATVQWVSIAYLLTITSLLLGFGRLGDMIGRKRILLCGQMLFTVASGLCGLTQTVEQLILLRAIQGIGAGMVMSINPAVVAASFPPSERGKAMGLNSVVIAAGAGFGPSLGGFLLQTMDWRMVFFARVPIGLAAAILASAFLREPSIPSRKERFDFAGAALITLGLSSLLLGLNRGQEDGWTSATTVSFVAAFAVLLVLFLIAERRISQPMLDLSLFRNRVFAAANASAMFNFITSSGTTFLMPFMMSSMLGFDPGHIGLVMTSAPIITVVFGPICGSLSDRFGSRWLTALGLSVNTAALLLMSGLGPDAGTQDVVMRLLLMGAGIALFQSPNSSAIMSSVPSDRLGVGAGMLATMRNLGMSMGVAVVGAVYGTRYAHYLAEGGGAAQTAATAAGFHDAFVVAALFAAVGVFTSLVRGDDLSQRKGNG